MKQILRYILMYNLIYIFINIIFIFIVMKKMDGFRI